MAAPESEGAPPPLEISPRAVADEFLGAASAGRLIDCRDPEEFAFNRILGAEHFPLQTLPFEAEARLGPDKTARIVVYCHHGMRSARAAEILRGRGYTNAQSLAGGIDRWSVEIDPEVPRY